MPVVAVVNRKGGCGKSTLATHLAAHLSRSGHAVMLADLDHSRSASGWLRQRQAQHPAPGPAIQGYVIEADRVFRRQPGVSHIVMDTPGGLHGFELARVACYADAILMPVCHSIFDREAAAACHDELLTMPRVASGRCKLAALGMRLDARTHGAAVLQDWAAKRQLPFIGVLRETQAYVRCIERGLSLFDLPGSRVAQDLAQWQAILAWLMPLMQPRAPAVAAAPRPFSPAPPVLKPRALGAAGASAGALPPATSTLGPALQRPAGQAATAPAATAAVAQTPAVQAAAAALAAAEARLRPAADNAPHRPGADRDGGWGQRLSQAWQALPLHRLLVRGS